MLNQVYAKLYLRTFLQEHIMQEYIPGTEQLLKTITKYSVSGQIWKLLKLNNPFG